MRSIPAKLTHAIVRKCLNAAFKGGLALLALVGGSSGAIAQIIATPESTSTEVNLSETQGVQFNITGGQRTGEAASDHNLFHSFDQFDLGAGQTANFITGSKTQNVLSHITGEASSINGRLQIEGSNANLYLINPAGILFGPNAQLNLSGSFTATSATAFGFSSGEWIDFTDPYTLPDYELLFGNPTAFRFDTAGAVSNAGSLSVNQGEYISLAGGSVLNAGTLLAPGGALNLAAVQPGSLVRLSQQGHLLSLEVLSEEMSANPSSPQSLSELLTGNIADYADTLIVDDTGTVRLIDSSVPVPDKGRAIASGNLSTDNNNGVGGSINIIGTQVGITDADLSASGTTGGGTLRIGGGYLEQALIPTADQTYVDRQSTLTADALEAGSGGQIYVHSNLVATQFYGELSAQGGSISGDGGNVEIASNNRFTYSGTADLEAPQGDNGNIFFSAYNAVIKDGDQPESSPAQGSHPIKSFFSNADYVYGDSFLYEQSLEELTNITISTLHDITLEDLADDALTFSPGSHVTFQADSDNDEGSFIASDLEDTIRVSGGTVEIAAGNLAANAESKVVVGGIDVSASESFPTDGTIQLQSANFISAQGLNAGRGDIKLISNGINLGQANSVRAATITIQPSDENTNIQVGSVSADSSTQNSNTLVVSGADLAALDSTIGQVNIGSSLGTGTITVLEDPLLSETDELSRITLLGNEDATLVGPDVDTLWTITGANGGTLSNAQANVPSEANGLRFTGIGTLAGGSGNDTIHFANANAQITERIIGGSGSLIFTGEDIDLEAHEVSGDGGTLRLFGETASDDIIQIGGDDLPGRFNLTDAEYAAITGFDEIEIGSSSGGVIAINTDNLTTNTALTLSGNTITANDINVSEADSLTLAANGDINVGNITSQGGDIDLSSTRNITTGYISAGNSTQITHGGNISIVSAGNVLVTESLLIDGIATSLETTPNGRITVRHGGNGETPFVVGNASSDGPGTNGTVGQITDSDVSLANISIDGSLSEGNIEILTEVPEVSEESPAEVLTEVPDVLPRTVTVPIATTIPVSEDRSDISLDIVLANADTGRSITNTFNQIETSAGVQFANYLSLTNRETPTKVATLSQVQDTLNRVSEKSQRVRSALIYIYFVPDAADIASVRPDKDREPQPDDQLEVMLITADGEPVRYRQWGITREKVETVAAEFRRQATSQFSTPAQYLEPAQQLYQWMIAPLEPHLSEKSTNNLAMIMDDGLRTLPLAALHDGDKFLVEKYSLGLLPTFSLTDFGLEKNFSEQAALEADKAVRVLAMGASQFADQPPLPAVAAELAFISDDLQLGDAFLNESFTLENLKTKVDSQRYGVIHLATHAVFETGDIENSYIQLWDRRMGLSQLQELNFEDSNIDLIILSACSTAMGDRNSEYGFAGFAVSAGSQSALASLWPVSDEGTLGFMTQFYDRLPSADIRAEALRTAQINMIQGNIGIRDGQMYGVNNEILATIPELEQSGTWDFSHPFYWSAFTMIGSPW